MTTVLKSMYRSFSGTSSSHIVFSIQNAAGTGSRPSISGALQLHHRHVPQTRNLRMRELSMSISDTVTTTMSTIVAVSA